MEIFEAFALVLPLYGDAFNVAVVNDAPFNPVVRLMSAYLTTFYVGLYVCSLLFLTAAMLCGDNR